MGFFDNFTHSDAQDHHSEVYGKEHKGHLSHEVIAGAAAFEAVKAYENKRKEEGHPTKHALAKEIFAGLAAAEIDKLVETKGLDYLDKEKAKKHAKEAAEKLYTDKYENCDD
uniref:3-hydroxy-3-methylglutaryl-coenzyme A reductase n=1 Tax=Anthurium amnicola TaxID=1678845 RepID=A0A1D1YT27_9ARAE